MVKTKIGTPSRADAYFSSFESQLVGMTLLDERKGFLRCKSLVKEAMRVFTEGEKETPRWNERTQRVDSEGLQHLETTSRVVGGLRHADTKIPLAIATEVQLQTHSTGRGSVVHIEADVLFSDG